VPDDDSCVLNLFACLESTALNFGCSLPGIEVCGITDGNGGSGLVRGDVKPTTHAPVICITDATQFSPLDDARAGEYVLSLLMAMDGNIEDFNDVARRLMVEQYCETMSGAGKAWATAQACIDESTSTVSAGSLYFSITTTCTSVAIKNLAANSAKSSFGSTAGANAIFVGAPGTVLTVPVITVAFKGGFLAYVPSSSDMGGIIGGAVGGAFGGIMFCFLMCYLWKKRQSKQYKTEIVPA